MLNHLQIFYNLAHGMEMKATSPTLEGKWCSTHREALSRILQRILRASKIYSFGCALRKKLSTSGIGFKNETSITVHNGSKFCFKKLFCILQNSQTKAKTIQSPSKEDAHFKPTTLSQGIRIRILERKALVKPQPYQNLPHAQHALS